MPWTRAGGPPATDDDHRGHLKHLAHESRERPQFCHAKRSRSWTIDMKMMHRGDSTRDGQVSHYLHDTLGTRANQMHHIAILFNQEHGSRRYVNPPTAQARGALDWSLGSKV
jgi:hypothetical protein